MNKIAACLIVKDAAEIIEKCLDSIRPYVDEINVYDTGSSDGTLALLEKLAQHDHWVVEKATGRIIQDPRQPEGQEDFPAIPLAPIRVERGEWRDDFAWAREQSFAMCSDDVEWVIWLDDDDVIVGAEHLRMLAATAPQDCDAFGFLYEYARDEAGNCVCQLWRERLLRRSAGYTWRNPVHEVLVPPEGALPVIQFVPPELVRYIHDRPADRYPTDRNLAILTREKEKAEAEGRPIDPRTLAYLGTELMAQGKFAEATEYLHAYIGRPDACWSDERCQVHHKLATCLNILGNPLGAIEVELQAVKERHDWAENYIGLAQSYSSVGNWPAALHYAESAMKFGMPQSALILNPLEFSLMPLLIAAEAQARLGQVEQARARLAQLVQLFPEHAFTREKVAALDHMMSENEIVAWVLNLREVLLRHDEAAKAHALMESVPYLIGERPEIVRARAETREMVAHMLRPAEYRHFYAEEPKVSMIPTEYLPGVEDAPRMMLEVSAHFVLDGLREQEDRLGRKPRVLDLGCNDAFLASALWQWGAYTVDGVELNREAVAKGRERLKLHGSPARLERGDLHDAPKLMRGRYDAICLFEVIEHVPDVEETLAMMEGLLAPGGRIYMSTPNGAFDRGNSPYPWAKVERKGHLRAMPAQEFADILLARGELQHFTLELEGRETFVCYEPKERKGKIIFFAGGGWEQWSPASVNDGGLGGSETALCYVAVGLAQAGWQVKVYSSAEPGFYAGSLWRPAEAFDPSEECDLLVVSRLPQVVDTPLAAKRVALWCHDHSYPGILTEERIALFDAIVVLSEWQRDRFARLYPSSVAKLVVIRNGIALNALGEPKFPNAERPWGERKPRCIYSSSADRGLDVLLEVWPRIRRRVPDAELHVFYGWNVFDAVARQNPALYAYKAKVLGLIEKAGGEEGGVFIRGRVGQKELTAEMQDARVLTYPTAFLETSCITAMEAKAAGLPIVTSDLGALRETAALQALIPWNAERAESIDILEATKVNETMNYQDVFVGHVIALLTSEGAWKTRHDLALADAAANDWANRIPDWEAVAPQRQVEPKRSRRHRRAA